MFQNSAEVQTSEVVLARHTLLQAYHCWHVPASSIMFQISAEAVHAMRTWLQAYRYCHVLWVNQR